MLTYGFYNSLNHDRLYDAVQVSSIFDGVIEDGVYSNIGEFLATVPGNGMQVIVKTGRAWFDHTWTLNDSYIPLDIEESDPLQTRIDAVILEVDSRIEKRENSIKISQGIPSVNPVKPKLLHEGGVYQHALAYVTVVPNATTITNQDIEIVVGKEDGTPFVRCPLETVSIADLWQQWEGEFQEWFDHLKEIMTDNVATHLQAQIEARVKIADKATEEDISNGTTNKWVDSAALKKETKIENIMPSGTGITSFVGSSILGPNVVPCDGRIVNRGEFPELDNTPYADRMVDFEYVSSANATMTNVITNHAYCIGGVSYTSKVSVFAYSSNIYIKTPTGSVNTLCTDGVCWLIYSDRIYVGRASKVSVFDADGGLVKEAAFTGYYIGYIYPIDSNRFVAIGYYGGNEQMYVTTDSFTTYTISTINNSSICPTASCFFPTTTINSNSSSGMYGAFKGYPKSEYNEPFSLMQKHNNYLYTTSCGAYYGTENILVSKDYGYNWTTLCSFASSFNGASFGIINEYLYTAYPASATIYMRLEKRKITDGSIIENVMDITSTDSIYVGRATSSFDQANNVSGIGAAYIGCIGISYLSNGKAILIVWLKGYSRFGYSAPSSIGYVVDILNKKTNPLILGGVNFQASFIPVAGLVPVEDNLLLILGDGQLGPLSFNDGGGDSTTYYTAPARSPIETYLQEQGCDSLTTDYDYKYGDLLNGNHAKVTLALINRKDQRIRYCQYIPGPVVTTGNARTYESSTPIMAYQGIDGIYLTPWTTLYKTTSYSSYPGTSSTTYFWVTLSNINKLSNKRYRLPYLPGQYLTKDQNSQ